MDEGWIRRSRIPSSDQHEEIVRNSEERESQFFGQNKQLLCLDLRDSINSLNCFLKLDNYAGTMMIA